MPNLVEQIEHALGVLLVPGNVAEMRLPNTNKATVSGYYSDFHQLALDAVRWDGRATVYVTLNPVDPELLDRRVNHTVDYAKSTTSDSDILCRRWFLVDCDPVRKADLSATDDEKALARQRGTDIRCYMREIGFSEAVVADSGNGDHSLFLIDLPNDDEHRKLLETDLKALAAMFDDAVVTVDQTVFNASRVCKLYGTTAVKGDNTERRPHRRAAILHVPDVLETTDVSVLQRLAAQLPKPATAKQPVRSKGLYVADYATPFDIEDWMSSHGLQAKIEKQRSSGDVWVLDVCPWDSSHTDKSAFVMRLPSGAIAAGCHHNGCSGKDWFDLREKFEPKSSRAKKVETTTGRESARPGPEDNADLDSPKPVGKGGPSELELAESWTALVRDTFAYVEGDQWWRYEGGRWHYSSLEAVQAAVQAFLVSERENDERIAVTRARVQNVVFLAKSMLGPIPLSVFDSQPDWIPLRNGVYDTRTGDLLPHSPGHRLTHQAPYDYEPDAGCPRWEKFLQESLITTDGLPHSEWIGIVQEWFGVCMVPDISAQAAMFWVGEGGNGKGVATRALEGIIGTEYCTAIPIEQLHDPYYRASLYGKLVGLVNEPDPKAIQKNGTFFKALTGGDRIDARRPTEKVFSFTPTCRLVVSCNDLPATKDVSKGYFRRIILIEWRYNVPEKNKDSGLDDLLRAELPGMFNWAALGLRRWAARGRRFNIPKESSSLLDAYRRDEDTFARFLDEETVREAEAFIANSDLYGAYAQWSKRFGERPDTSASIGRRLKKQGLVSDVQRIPDGKTARGWKGLKIRPDEVDEDGGNA